MKKNNKSFLTILILLVLSLGLIISPVKTNADSGWDSDYDSGSWDSGSSWDSDYSSGSSYHSSSGGDPVVVLIFIVIVVVIIIASTNNRNKPRSGGGSSQVISKNNYQDISEEKIKEIDSNINISEFKTKVFQTYKELQTAWMNFDTDTIRKLTTDEIYNMYSSQLETLKLKNQKNIMKNITLEDVKIIDISKENNVITMKVYLNVKCYDYVINETTNKTVRGRDDRRINIEYILSFVKSASNNSDTEKCPNCGAPIKMKASANCPYCDSTLVKSASDYVMSKKTCVGQRLE